MKRVILVRHGESAAQRFSQQQRWDPTLEKLRDPHLSDEGVRQASALGAHWKTLGPPPTLVVCSPLSRAVETAALLFPAEQGVTVIAHPDLRESSPGGQKAVGKPSQLECRGRLLQHLRGDPQFRTGKIDWSLVPEGPWWSDLVEAPDAVESRLCAFSHWLENRPEPAAVVVCHFNIIQRLMAIRRFKVENCSPICAVVTGREWAPLDQPSPSPVDFWSGVHGDKPAQMDTSIDVDSPAFRHGQQDNVTAQEPVRPQEKESLRTNGSNNRRWGKASATRGVLPPDPSLVASTSPVSAAPKPSITEKPQEVVSLDPSLNALSAPVSTERLPSPQEKSCQVAEESLFDCFAVLDFEATCDEPCQPEPQEIIEFPIVLVHASTGKVLSEFRTYVQPVHHPRLTAFCTQLTGISQATVDDAPTWCEAFHEVQTWLHAMLEDLELYSCICVTCGDWDLNSMMGRQCALSGMHVPEKFQRWVNVKNLFRRVTGKSGGGMKAMLNMLGLRLEGHHHSGLDDSRNIARILTELLQRGGSVDMEIVSTSAQRGISKGKAGGKGGGKGGKNSSKRR